MPPDAPAQPVPPFTPQALEILRARYLLRDRSGEVVEEPADCLWRVARALAAAETRWGRVPEGQAQAFYEVLAALRFLPNSPTLMNAGKPAGQLSACFVLPIEDSLTEIFDAVKYAAVIHGTGGGTGFAFSRLRPKEDPLGTGGRASGPVSFMRVFNAATGAVNQGGVRRGANMGVLRVDHPDVLDFVRVKRDPAELTHFNVSVAITDAFMQALAAGSDYALVHPRTGEELGRADAREVWDEILDSAWRTGDPGLIFIDRINAEHPTPALGQIESTNPCGELPLLPYESCNLGSVDVGKHVRDGAVDWDALRATVILGVRMLDDVIEANHFPLPAIHDVTAKNRKIGLGIMGWADLLVELGVPYASQEALDLAHELMGFVLREARAASTELARERGAFPAWGGSRWEREGLEPLRNATVTTIAPTGTISILAGCSSGIEPLYALSYVRRTLDGTRELTFVHPALERLARAHGFWRDDLPQRVAQNGGSLAGVPGVPPAVQTLLATAHEIPPSWHVRHQAAFQAHVENAVSKTVNLPRSATAGDVGEIYRQAYLLGCKGITVYRDGSREGQVLRTLPAEPPEAAGPSCPECSDPFGEQA
ncbi:MAG: adenosylcobalamin-dependent ribonucleoside-diphosphate reductase [Planctomycetota bacterium]